MSLDLALHLTSAKSESPHIRSYSSGCCHPSNRSGIGLLDANQPNLSDKPTDYKPPYESISLSYFPTAMIKSEEQILEEKALEQLNNLHCCYLVNNSLMQTYSIPSLMILCWGRALCNSRFCKKARFGPRFREQYHAR